MKILIVCQYYYPEPFSITEIAEGLVSRGHEVTVLTSKPNYGYYKIIPGYEQRHFEVLNGVKVHRVNVYPRKGSKMSIVHNYLSFYMHANRYIKKIKEKFEVVFSMSLSPVISVTPAIRYAKKHHVKHVLHCLDLWPESVVATGMIKKDSLSYRILYKWSRDIYNKIDTILISSPSFSHYFADVLHLENKNIKYVPQPTLNITPLNPFVYDEAFINILYCGNIGKLQMVNLLVAAMNKLNNPRIRLYLIGLGSETEAVLQNVKAFNLQNNIIYLGPKPRIEAARYCVHATAFYVGLNSDGFVGNTIPNKITMYMKYGHPIISVVDGDAKELLEKAQGDSLLSLPTINDLANTLNVLSKMSAEELNNMGKQNSDYYEKYLATDYIIDEIADELKSHC